MSATPGGDELRRHMAGVAPSAGAPGRDAGRSVRGRATPAGRMAENSGMLAQRAKTDPLMTMLLAGSIGYGLGWLTALAQSPKREPLPDYARKRA